MEEKEDWQVYYSKASLEPRATLVRALEYFKENEPKEKTAIDLACGNGNDTVGLLKNGWTVYAIDSSEMAIKPLIKLMVPLYKEKLTVECVTFMEVNWKTVTLVNASFSLPFCSKANLELRNLFNNFEIVFFKENEYDGPTAVGPEKHWHLFEILAVKK